jgi:sugar lactone lactonase YvrE
MARQTSLLLGDLTFAEGPRWHDGRLWFSEMHRERVMAVDLDRRVETIVEVPGRPSGLGWRPEGRLLIVSMSDRRLLGHTDNGLAEVADLSDVASFDCNDMVVDARGALGIQAA